MTGHSADSLAHRGLEPGIGGYLAFELDPLKTTVDARGYLRTGLAAGLLISDVADPSLNTIRVVAE